jgi:hypothetical protein
MNDSNVRRDDMPQNHAVRLPLKELLVDPR